ncbi:hypothetical protein ASC87_00180 [Rhizobacter sp. Root1221]|nr:hypothetical protein ASC87_00180 [Rhizobacter sp. Root1221]
MAVAGAHEWPLYGPLSCALQDIDYGRQSAAALMIVSVLLNLMRFECTGHGVLLRDSGRRD